MTRPRFGSRPDREVHAPDVYEILAKHDEAINDLKDYAQQGKLADVRIIDKLERIEATDRHATTKLIAGLVVTVVTTIGGVVGTLAALKPSPAAAPVVVQRSELDKKMDTCRGLPLGPSRSECLIRIASEPEP